MAYNIRMAHISLVLPFALPAPEFASDLIRALEAPGLAALLSRTSFQRFHPLEAAARVLPHELFIARTLGLAQGVVPRLATSAMRGHGLDPDDGTWFIVNPAHIQIASTHLLMSDPRQLDLREDEGRALFESACTAFEEAGYVLRYGSADTWFMRADGWNELHTSSPDAAVGMNLTDWMPSGSPSRAFRKLQNEVQVTWYTHPVNAAREARGQVAVNAIWPWGSASRAAVHAQRLLNRPRGPRPLQRSPETDLQPHLPPHLRVAADARHQGAGLPRLVTVDAPGWLTAMSARPLDRLADVMGEVERLDAGEELLVVCGNAAGPAIAADWAGWLQEMARLEEELFAPLLAALGPVKQLRLVLSHRDGHLETTTTPMAQRKFWRRPTLEALS
jgi:hypothetical protein